jgi:hypothetical protein
MNVILSDQFWTSAPAVTSDSLQARLRFYEGAVADLLSAMILIARWAPIDQIFILERIFLRLAEICKFTGGLVVWQRLRWYPISLLAYASGLAALSARNYEALGPILLTMVQSDHGDGKREILAVRAAKELNEIADAFKLLPEHQKQRTPRNEYMFNLLRNTLDEALFLGSGYEWLFDQFEILSTLVYVDITAADLSQAWAMPGRFVGKHYLRESVYNDFVSEAEKCDEDWPPLKIGLFASSASRFSEVASAYRKFLDSVRFYG